VLIFETLSAHQRSAALRSAIELDLFRAIGEGPGTVASLAKACNASERGIRILCDFLTIIGIQRKTDGLYSHTESSAMFLDPRSPACMASTVGFLSLPAMLEPFGRLTEIVRQGRTTLPGEGTVAPENPDWVEFAESMAPMMAGLAPALSQLVTGGRTGPMQVLDIAAGHGLFGIEVAKQNPDARVVAQDWESVLKVAARNAKSAGVESRYTLLAGSAFEVDYGGPYDVVLLTNFLHHFDRETCVRLLRKVHASLTPGGQAATLEFVPNDDRVSPQPAAAFSLVMLASTVAGDAYTFRELESMYQEAGFRDIAYHPIPRSPQGIVIGSA
ncbi:MAG TPA: class I SAM-dependent methyltransferase, partial [Bryobacteraceae bacterium]|nr:class I SAM-dependent methyltransferase [Bryobacteraceae bacterium]